MSDLFFVTLVLWAICVVIILAILERTIRRGFEDIRSQLNDCREMLNEIKNATEISDSVARKAMETKWTEGNQDQ